MEPPLFDFLGSYWWLIFPIGGMAGGWARSWSKASEERHRRKVELLKLRNQLAVHEEANQAEVVSLIAAHDSVNHRWLEYELDVGNLIDFPLMTDVREPPLTVAFLRAKKEADAYAPPLHPRTFRRRPGWLSTGQQSTVSNSLSTLPNGKPGALRTATSAARNGSDWLRQGSCSELLKTPQPPPQPNVKRRTNVPAKNSMA